MQTVHQHTGSSNGVHEHRGTKLEELSEILQP